MRAARRGAPEHEIELEVLAGLLEPAREELGRLGFPDSTPVSREAAVFRARGPLPALCQQLAGARLAVAFHLVLTFDVPRPRALLGDEHFRRLAAHVRETAGSGGHRGFRFSAAGADSSVFQRLAAALSAATGLRHAPDDGELLIRVRRTRKGAWQVLLRLFPRPLSARSWRHCNLEGGLNATIAAAMNGLLLENSRVDEPAFLNAMCGSGTLLAEWCTLGTGGSAAGFDISESALRCAASNLAHCSPAPELFRADATDVPRPAGSFDLIATDPPWGDDIGSSADNARLYPAFLSEAARLLAPGGLLVIASHEVRLMQRLLGEGRPFVPLREFRVWHGGHRPGIWLLRRR